MPAKAPTVEGERIKEAPVTLGALPTRATPEKKRPPPLSGLSPVIPAERYSALLTKAGEEERGSISQSRLLDELQKGYGNRYTEKVVAGYRERTDERKQIERGLSLGKASEPAAATPKAPKRLVAGPELKETPPFGIGRAEAPTTAPGETKASAIEGAEIALVEPVEAKPAAGAEEGLAEKVAEGAETEEAKAPARGEPALKGPAVAKVPGAVPAGPAAVEVAAEKPAGRTTAKLLEAGAEAFKKATWRIKTLRKHQRTHKSTQDKMREAKAAVVPPRQEAQSRANAEQVELVGQRTAPAPNEAAARQSMEDALVRATPQTLEEMDDFKKRGGGRGIRARVLNSVRSQTQAVQKTYQDIGQAPKAEAPAGESAAIPEPEEAPGTVALQLGKELVPQVPEDEIDLSSYENEVEQQMVKEGIDEETLAQVDSGPLAEAKTFRSELKADVAKGPAELRKQEQIEKAGMEKELGADEMAARGKMKGARKAKLGTVKGRQGTAKKSEEDIRQKVTENIQRIYEKAKTSVTAKLADLEKVSVKRFDDGQQAATERFENGVDKKMRAFKAERYSGALGKGKWLWDKLAGLDSHPRVLAIFSNAKRAFVGELDILIKNIAADTKKVIDECKAEIQQAKTTIAEYVKSLRPSLRKTAMAAQKEMMAKLNALDRQVDAKAQELQEKLAERRKKAIKAIDEKIAKMKEKLKGFVSKIGGLLLNALLKLFEWALKAVGAPVKKIMGSLERAGSALKLILKDPIRFLGNLIKALGQGFSQFSKNILLHLKRGLLGWLFGTMAKAGITMPTEFSIKAIFGLVMQILDLTASAIKKKVAKYIGEENVERIAKVWQFISTLISKGVGGLWEMMKEYLSNLKEVVIGAIQEWLITQIIKQAVIWIISLFNPVAAIIKAIQAIYKVVMFIIERIQQILAVVEAILGSLAEIAMGAIGKAADWIEAALGRLVPVVIGFLASLLGISGITAKIRSIIKKIRTRVHTAVDKVIAKVATKIGGLFGRGKKERPKKEEEALPPDKKKLWTQGQAAIEQLKKRSEADPFDEKTISQSLKQIKERYKFKKLDHRLEGDKWVIISRMSPDEDRDVAKARPTAGTEKNPLPLIWPKRPSHRYATIYLGGPIHDEYGKYVKQSDLKKKVGKKDMTGFTIKEYKPHREEQVLPKGEKIGLSPDYRIKKNKLVGPLSDKSTPGGSKMNKILKKYGFNPKDEYMDGDHVVEIQMGGVDTTKNLWPLDASENRGAGSILSKTTVEFPDGKEQQISKLKTRRRKYYFKIKDFRY